MLENLEAQADGQWKLVKVNVDENQELAAHFGVRSIPHVVAFAEGQAVDQFTGVLPESGLREFLSRLTPNPAQLALHEAQSLAAAGDRQAAGDAFQSALALDPGSDAARSRISASCWTAMRSPTRRRNSPSCPRRRRRKTPMPRCARASKR